MNSADYRVMEMAVQLHDGRACLSSGEKDAAARVGWSQEHLDVLFEQWAGVDLSRFMQGLGLARTRQKLQAVKNLLAGSSAVESCCLSRSLSEEQGKGEGLTIRYGSSSSPFGECLLAMTDTGEICHLSFVDEEKQQEQLEELRCDWPQATIIADAGEFGGLLPPLFSPTGLTSADSVRLLVKGTSFQLKVWCALLALPFGSLISYQGLAGYLGHPTACRAVAGAVAANPVAWLIPCHRVIRQSGEIHRYRWGDTRKKMMLGWEEACIFPLRAGAQDGY